MRLLRPERTPGFFAKGDRARSGTSRATFFTPCAWRSPKTRPVRADVSDARYPLGSLARKETVRAPLRLLLAAYCLLLALPLCADVFWRIPKQADAVLQGLGGVCVYSTDVRLNGAPGVLSTYSFDQTSSDVLKGLAGALGIPAAESFAGALLTHREQDRMRRFFVLPSASGTSACAVLVFDQALRDFERAGKDAPVWPEGLPALATVPLFSAVCAKTGTAFAIAETPEAPQAAVQTAAQTLSQTGWSEVTASATPTFKMFASGKKICLLFASHHAQTDRTTISVLQREGATP